MTAPTTERREPLRPDFAGRVLGGRYRLERPIGTGAMATVWRAMHIDLERAVAVKFLHLGGRGPAAIRERFLREAKVAASVRHRFVADILDFGTTEEGTPYMVMELLAGRTLASRYVEGRLRTHETVSLMARVLSGLGAVHDAGIVHRDLKPENIFLAEDADGIIPKLLDFGVSKTVEGPRESVIPTKEDVIAGTPQYMAPEQARGLRDVDGRADLWAVGVMLYEGLSDHLPFDAEHPGDLLVMVMQEEPAPLAALRPDLGAPLVEVVERAMHKDPEQRYQTARAMRQALLEAAARTAAAAAAGALPLRPSELPPVDPAALMGAVGDAYEPGDSGVIEIPAGAPPGPASRFRASAPTHGASPRAGDEPLPGPPPLPDLPGESTLLDRLAPPAAEDVTTDETLAPAQERARSTLLLPRPGRRRLLLVLGLLGLGVVAGVAAWRAGAGTERAAQVRERSEQREPPVPAATSVGETVEVRLEGLFEGAEVELDGAPVSGPTLALPRSQATHRIVVRAPDHLPWSVSHPATRDGRYAVELVRAPAPTVEPETTGEADPPGARPRARPRPRPRPAGGAGQMGDLLRDPGF